jgi:hypothetical protein
LCFAEIPAGWAASLGRGLLPGIAFAVAMLVVAQVSVLADFASWVPFVALSERFSRRSNRPRRATTIMTWRRLELDK